MKFALFGAGRIGGVHAENIAGHPAASLLAVYDVRAEAAQEVAESTGADVARSEDEIWDNTEIDAVLIASSTNTHVDLIRAAIASGKAVYCEKPVDLDLSKTRSLAVEAQHSDVPVFVGFRRRFISELQSIRGRIERGDIGPVEVVHMLARDGSPPPESYIRVSGGLIRDKAIHYFDLLCWLTGEAPVEVSATGACVVDPTIGELCDVDTVMLTLKMPSGALCHITNGRRSAYGMHEHIEIYGASGTLEWRPLPDRHIALTSGDGVCLSPTGQTQAYFRQETFAAALDRFIGDVNAGRPVVPSLADGLRAEIIADAATSALGLNRPVAILY